MACWYSDGNNLLVKEIVLMQRRKKRIIWAMSLTVKEDRIYGMVSLREEHGKATTIKGKKEKCTNSSSVGGGSL